jgi:hypothetical protein
MQAQPHATDDGIQLNGPEKSTAAPAVETVSLSTRLQRPAPHRVVPDGPGRAQRARRHRRHRAARGHQAHAGQPEDKTSDSESPSDLQLLAAARDSLNTPPRHTAKAAGAQIRLCLL